MKKKKIKYFAAIDGTLYEIAFGDCYKGCSFKDECMKHEKNVKWKTPCYSFYHKFANRDICFKKA